MCRLSWFLDPGGWSKAAVVGLYFIFPGVCTLSLTYKLNIQGLISKFTEDITLKMETGNQCFAFVIMTALAAIRYPRFRAEFPVHPTPLSTISKKGIFFQTRARTQDGYAFCHTQSHIPAAPYSAQ
ncbi:hypothetical protein STEG23_025333, partial [Scotinomys teguina]